MAREVAPPKSTGGGGYNFEDKVGAYLALHLLAGASPFGADLGPPQRIRTQARPDGWLLDDFVVEFPANGAAPVRAPVSVKSERAVKACRAPDSFVRDCWEQYLDPRRTTFDPVRDRLVLATCEVPANARAAIEDATARARAAPDEFDARILTEGYASEDVRAFVEGFACPGDLPDHPRDGRKVGPLLGAVVVRDFDFQDAASTAERDALALSRAVVAGGEHGHARALWGKLQSIMSAARTRAGTITLRVLLDELRGTVELKAHPEYAEDWARLRILSGDWRAATRDRIGALRLDRVSARDVVANALRERRVIALLGDSGVGKSAIAKAFAEDPDLEGRAFGLRADDLATIGGRAHDPRRRLAELLATQSASSALLVLDGVERLGDADARVAARVIDALDLENPRSPWRLLLTCQTGGWGRVREQLRANDARLGPVGVLNMAGLGHEALERVRQAHPQLVPLLSRADLLPLTSKPKVLDLLTSGTNEDLAEIQGEASLIEWFWRHHVGRGATGARRQRLLEKLARDEADGQRFATPLSRLSGDESELVPELEGLGLLATRLEAVSFTHDIYADYSRQRILVGQYQSGPGAALQSTVRNPRWHRATRLLAMDLLERRDDAGWESLLECFGADSAIGADLALEALAFCQPSVEALERAWPLLSANNGVLLRRLLTRVFYSTTAPISDFLEDAEQIDPIVRSELDVSYRLPDPTTWSPFVGWLVTHVRDVQRAAPEPFVAIAETWLRAGRRDSALPHLGALAGAALDFADHVARKDDQAYGRNGPDRKRVYELALVASKHHGARSTTLIRSWSRRNDERPDEAFVGALLSPLGATLLVELDPGFARDVFLDVLAERDVPADRGWSRSSLDDSLPHRREAYPPFHDFAPAAQLLRADYGIGIDFVLRLIAFATAAWQVDERVNRSRGFVDDERNEPSSVRLIFDEGERTLAGNRRVFEWHRTDGNVAGAVLMALEEWLYTFVESDRFDPNVLAGVLALAGSTAVLGVLFDVALRYPKLLLGPLEPLATSHELLLWGENHALEEATSTPVAAMTSWMGKPEPAQRRARTWHSLPHRRRSFRDFVWRLFVGERACSWPAIEKARVAWTRGRDAMAPNSTRDALDVVIAHFDPANIRREVRDGVELVRVELPPALAERGRSRARDAERAMTAITRPFLFRQLLDRQRVATEAELEAWLVEAETLEPNSDAELDEMHPRKTQRCGAAAVAVVLFPDWLERHPEWSTRCLEWLLGTCAEPPSRAGFADSPESIAEFWDGFCADALPALWAREPGSTPLRQALARLVAAPHYAAIRRLFAGLASLPATLAADVSRLLHLGLRFARLSLLIWAHQDLPPPEGVDSEQDLEAFAVSVAAPWGESCQAFVDGTLGSVPQDWPTLGRNWPPIDLNRPAWARSGFDGQYLVACSAWLQLDSTPAIEPGTETHVAAGLGMAVADRVRPMLGRERRGQRDHPLLPDYRLADLAAARLVHEPDAQARRRIWEPWLSLGLGGHDWAKIFLNALYSAGLGRSPGPPHFGAALAEIVAWGLESGSWIVKSRRKSDAIDTGLALMGISERRSSRWSQSEAVHVEALAHHWERWAGIFLSTDWVAEAFCRFLATDGARPLRARGLRWLDENEPEAEERTRDALARLLETCFSQGGQEVAPGSEGRRAFDDLLARLVGKQHAAAILLARRVATGRAG